SRRREVVTELAQTRAACPRTLPARGPRTPIGGTRCHFGAARGEGAQKKNCFHALHQSSARETIRRRPAISTPNRCRYASTPSVWLKSTTISLGRPGSYGATAPRLLNACLAPASRNSVYSVQWLWTTYSQAESSFSGTSELNVHPAPAPWQSITTISVAPAAFAPRTAALISCV